MYVILLYTNIPHDEGIEACREVWNNRINQRPLAESLIQLLEHILKFNDFMFNGEHYLQISGYGNKNCTILCQRLYGKTGKYTPPLFSTKPPNWLRLIDDLLR
jgi:hypothetical protein